MAFPTAVNSQITDSVTQTTRKVLADSPSMALGNLYLATAQALAMAAQNATYAQQQLGVTMQAATTVAVSTLFSKDKADLADLAVSKPSTDAAVPDNAVSSHTPPAAACVADVSNAVDAVPEDGGTLNQVDNHLADDASAWCKAVEQVMESMAYGLAGLQQVNYQANLDVIKQTGIALTLERMIAQPEKHAEYQAVLDSIQAL